MSDWALKLNSTDNGYEPIPAPVRSKHSSCWVLRRAIQCITNVPISSCRNNRKYVLLQKILIQFYNGCQIFLPTLLDNYRPQTKFAKVMFLQVSVCPRGGRAWLRGRACAVVGGGACVGYDEIRSMSGWYASYWNAFLFTCLGAFWLYLPLWNRLHYACLITGFFYTTNTAAVYWNSLRAV